MSLTVTHTFAELEVSTDTYDEIAEKLRRADYDHAFLEDGTIDMHGIGLTKGKPAAIAPTELPEPVIISRGSFEASAETVKKYGPKLLAALNNPSLTYVTQAERKCKCPYSPVVSESCWCHEKMGNDFWFLPADACIYEKPNRMRAAWRSFWVGLTGGWK